MKKLLRILALLALAALGHAATATYRVTQDVGSLSLRDSDLFLDFQLTDGAQTGADNSTVRVNNLRLTTGSFALSDRTLADAGLVTGTNADFTLHNYSGDDGVASERAVRFHAGSGATLSYDFTVTNTSVDVPTPDGFTVAMICHTGNGTGLGDLAWVGTDAPAPAGDDYGIEMVQKAFDGGAALPKAYGVSQAFAVARAKAGDGRFTGLGTPVVTPVPEPASLTALGLGALALLRRRK